MQGQIAHSITAADSDSHDFRLAVSMHCLLPIIKPTHHRDVKQPDTVPLGSFSAARASEH